MKDNLSQAGLLTLFKWSGVLFTARVAGAVAAYVVQIGIARWLGADVLGQYVLAFSMVLIMSVAATAGFAEAAPRYVGIATANKDYSELKGFIQRGQQVTIACSITLLLIGSLITWSYASTTYQAVLLIAWVVVPAFALIRFFAGVAQGYAKLMLREFPNSVVRPILFTTCVYLAYLLTSGVDAVFLLILHGVLIVSTTAYMYLRITQITENYTKHTTARYRDREWATVAPSLAIAGAFYMYLPELVNLSVSRYLEPMELAHLNAAMRTGMLVLFAIYSIDSAYLPRATKHLAAAQFQDLERWVLRTALLKIISTLTALVVFLLLGKEILSLFGSDFHSASTALYIFAAGLLIRVLIAPPLQLMNLAGQQSACVVASITSLLVLITSTNLLVPAWGINGAAISAVLSMIAWGLVLTLPAYKKLGFHSAPLAWALTALYKRFIH